MYISLTAFAMHFQADAEESGVLNVNAAANTLNLVLRDEGLMRFVKYVSFAAPGSRWEERALYGRTRQDGGVRRHRGSHNRRYRSTVERPTCSDAPSSHGWRYR